MSSSLSIRGAKRLLANLLANFQPPAYDLDWEEIRKICGTLPSDSQIEFLDLLKQGIALKYDELRVLILETASNNIDKSELVRKETLPIEKQILVAENLYQEIKTDILMGSYGPPNQIRLKWKKNVSGNDIVELVYALKAFNCIERPDGSEPTLDELARIFFLDRNPPKNISDSKKQVFARYKDQFLKRLVDAFEKMKAEAERKSI